MHTPLRLASAALAALFVVLPPAHAAFPPTALKPIVLQQIHSPTTIAYPPDGSGRIFICDQIGKIYIIQGGMLLPTPFLNIANPANVPPNNGPGPVVPLGLSYDERGLLGLAFHPGFADSLSPGYRKFYLNYNKIYSAATDPAPPQAGDPINCVTVISEFEVSATDPNVAVVASERRVLAFTQPQFNHNGGVVEFGPDGLLYIGSGDGGSSNDNNAGHTGGLGSPRPTNNLGNGQDRTRYLGKILRIDPLDPDGAGPLTYSIPATNPFFSDPTPGLKKEIYAFGLRNPWKLSFDSRPGGTDRLFCGDVGQGRIEEINLIVSGGNYGWRYKEGLEFPTFSVGSPVPSGTVIDPIAMYGHSMPPNYTPPTGLPELGLSVTGGYVYRGAAIPGLQGKYIFGDYGATGGTTNGRLMGLEEIPPVLSENFAFTEAIPLVTSANPIPTQRILCLGEDQDGEIYLGLKTKGGVTELDGVPARPSGGIYKLVAPKSVSLPAIEAEKDNTIFSDGEPALANGNSNGNGSYLFTGWASPFDREARRALLAFNLSSVPVGASITAAALHLYCDKQANVNPLAAPFNLHRLTAAWGEGFSNSDAGMPGSGAAATAGDATWRLRLVAAAGPPPTGDAWTVPGGDFTASPSATTTVGNPSVNPYVWSSSQNAQLAADVNAWLAAPATNLGWILVAPEGNGVGATAKRFLSRENPFNPGATPKLYLTYGAAPDPTHFENWLAAYFPTNLTGQYVDPRGDLEGDGIFNLIEYAFGFSPLAANPPPNAGLQVTTAPSGPNTVVTIVFRRDPLATDLNYYLETSGDLSTWTVITQSLAGGVPTGVGYQSEVPTLGSAPRQVTATRTLPTPAAHFVRLSITQQ